MERVRLRLKDLHDLDFEGLNCPLSWTGKLFTTTEVSLILEVLFHAIRFSQEPG